MTEKISVDNTNVEEMLSNGINMLEEVLAHFVGIGKDTHKTTAICKILEAALSLAILLLNLYKGK